jgi:hypothetical protein
MQGDSLYFQKCGQISHWDFLALEMSIFVINVKVARQYFGACLMASVV